MILTIDILSYGPRNPPGERLAIMAIAVNVLHIRLQHSCLLAIVSILFNTQYVDWLSIKSSCYC